MTDQRADTDNVSIKTNGKPSAGNAALDDEVPPWLTMTLEQVAKFVESKVAPLRQRIQELEAQPFLRETGVWEANKSYGIGSVCSDRGSAWVALKPTALRPGEGNNSWRLLVKKGRDGKDAR